ncbi:MAG: GH92 family glycosyl hydrolase [Sinobacterium sp.]|nr:GH92 family glycosyl hydrolase [Sinobacterium sp.]
MYRRHVKNTLFALASSSIFFGCMPTGITDIAKFIAGEPNPDGYGRSNANTSVPGQLVSSASVNYANNVDPFIGTADEGNTYPGAVLPWGMASPSPQNQYTKDLDLLFGQPSAAGGYYYGDPVIEGFGQTHISGAGCPALGAPIVVPVTGKKMYVLEPDGFKSDYSDEVAFPGYYSVNLDRFGVKAELTATKRVGVHRFTFPDNGKKAWVGIDVIRSLSWTSHIERKGPAYVRVTSDTEMEGGVLVGNFCKSGNTRKLFWAAKTTTQPQENGTYGWWTEPDKHYNEGDVGGYWRFSPGQSVEVFVGLSYTSVENARNNLDVEIANRSFDEISVAAVNTWEETLGRIAVTDDNVEKKKTFYTALYHSLLNPAVIADVNGDHPGDSLSGSDGNTTYVRYDAFGLWDTYRGVHPLLSLVYPEVQQDMVITLENMALMNGKSPKWVLSARENNIMVGDPALIVLADAYKKGFRLAEPENLFNILYAGAVAGDNAHRPRNNEYINEGYVPHKPSALFGSDKVWGAVSSTLENSLADWSLAQMADGMGKTAERDVLLSNAAGWTKLYDDSTKMLRPRLNDGSWLTPFDMTTMKGERPMEGDLVGFSGGPGYVEGNAWQYSTMVPHAVDTLAALHGGTDQLKQHLDNFFEGGQFTLWNEPDIGAPYLYSMLDGSIAETQTRIIEERGAFNNSTHGIPGNDDTGALSAWYVFTAMGFYPANPVSGEYALGMPLFDKVTISLKDGKQFTVNAQSDSQAPLPAVSLNGNSHTDGTISYQQVIDGGEMNFSN